MENLLKQEIQAKVREHLGIQEDGSVLDGYPSQNQLVHKLEIDKGYVSKIVNGKWTETAPSKAVWSVLARFFDMSAHIDSENYLNITAACKMFQEQARNGCIDGYTGAGKSYALDRYERMNKGVYLIRTQSYMNKADLLHVISDKLGVPQHTHTSYFKYKYIINKIKSSPYPVLLIFDEIEYLKPYLWHDIKALMDELKQVCGIVISGIFMEDLEAWAKKEKKGMPQFLRRIKHSRVIMSAVSKEDEKSICAQNDIVDREVIAWLYKHADNYETLVMYVTDLARLQQAGNNITIELCAQLFQD